MPNAEEKDINSYFKGASGTVGWIGVIRIGKPVQNDPMWKWSKNLDSIICDGYQCARLVRTARNEIYKVVASITKSALGVPIYSLASYLYDQVSKTFSENHSFQLSRTKATPAINDFLKTIDVPTSKRWQPIKFFGCDRQDVISLLDQKTSVVVDKICPASIETPQPSIPSVQCQYDLNVTWLGVENIGKRIYGQNESEYFYVF